MDDLEGVLPESDARSAERFRPDCGRCAALCCVAFEFERSADFAMDKPAGQPCANLDGCGQCRIYSRRVEFGFGGCIRHDCQGAGQRVVQDLFGGRTWLEEPALLEPMIAAFTATWEVHAMLALLASARGLTLPDHALAAISDLEGRLEIIAADACAPDARSRTREACKEVYAFLPTLQVYVGG